MLKYIKDINARRGMLGSFQRQLPSPGIWTEPEPRYYQELGKSIGINGDEIHIMLQHALKIQDPTCIKLFERFLMAAKMVSTEPLADYHAQRRADYERHLQAVEKHKRKTKQLEHQNARIKGSNNEIIEQIQRRWKKIIVYLSNRVESQDELTVEECIAYDVLAECMLASARAPAKVDVEACIALSFGEICNACSYMEQKMVGPVPKWPTKDDDDEAK